MADVHLVILRIQEELKCDVITGMRLLGEIVNGQSVVPPRYTDNEFIKKFKKVVRFLRWVACSQMQALYRQLSDDCDHKTRP